MRLFRNKNAILLLVEKFAFLKGLTHDSGQKFQISLEPTFLLREIMVRIKNKGLLLSLTALIHNVK